MIIMNTTLKDFIKKPSENKSEKRDKNGLLVESDEEIHNWRSI